MVTKNSRCPWAEGSDEMRHYHDTEWGVPVHDDNVHFEFITLEGAQAGLSWATILKRRAGYKKAFANFDPKKVAKFDEAKIEKLLLDPGIIRHKLKIESTVTNAQAFLKIQKEFGSFDAYIWAYVNNAPIENRHKSMATVPARTDLSDKISKDLKKRGFRFVGSTIIYAYMQAVGLVNDHLTSCPAR
ncbi:MAG TPA: DNA-3-methyladenine glycosylase I [Pseudomonadales bacterium]|nr:DNA-3-methyladenine glycosylase I [Pseudomonadales bacterium]